MKTIFSFVISIIVVVFTFSCGKNDNGPKTNDGDPIKGVWIAWDSCHLHGEGGLNPNYVFDTTIIKSYSEIIATTSSSNGITISNFRNLGVTINATVNGFSINVPYQFFCISGDCDEYVLPWETNGSVSVTVPEFNATISDDYNTINFFTYSDSSDGFFGEQWYEQGHIILKRVQ